MTGDRTTVHIVVVALAVIAVGLAATMAALNLRGDGIDPLLNSAASAALGALGALLATTRGTPTPVEVVNDDATPVPVEELGT